MFQHMPYDEAHQFLLIAGSLYADEDWDREEHVALWKEFNPPKTKADHKVLSQTCMGHRVPEEWIKEAREWKE